MTRAVQTLNDLMAVCHDGQNFYEYALTHTHDPTLRDVFSDMLRIRKDVITDLAACVAREGEQPVTDHSTFVGVLRQSYTKLKKTLSLNGDATLVAALEETEDRTLEAFQQALEEVTDPTIRQLLTRHHEIDRKTHERMRSLKRAAA